MTTVTATVKELSGWMLDKKDEWTIPATVVGARPSEKSYILETSRGIYLRNRKYLDTMSQQEQREPRLTQPTRSSAQVAGSPPQTEPFNLLQTG